MRPWLIRLGKERDRGEWFRANFGNKDSHAFVIAGLDQDLIRQSMQRLSMDHRVKPGGDDKENDESEKNYSAGVFGFGLKNVAFRLSQSTILAPFLCMITLCCATESELFQAQ